MGKFIFLNELYEEGTSENDPVVQAATWLRGFIEDTDAAKAQTFSDKFTGHYQEDEMVTIFDMFMAERDLVFAQMKAPETGAKAAVDVEGFFMVVLSLLTRLNTSEDVEQQAVVFCQLMSESSEHKEMKLKVMMVLYNMFQSEYIMRFPVFKQILEYCGKTGQFEKLVPYLSHLDEWLQDWQLEPKEQRWLFKTLAEKIASEKDSFEYLKRHVKLYNGGSAEEIAESVEATEQLVRKSIILPSVMQVDDIFTFDAVQNLRKTDAAKLVDLLATFMNGSLESFETFANANAGLFSGDIDRDSCMSKIRLLAMASMCHGKTELPLTDISKELQVEDVENWVVKALAAGVIDGRIDQIRQRLLVKSALQREFKDAEWDFLDLQVDRWLENIGNLKQIISQVQENNMLS